MARDGFKNYFLLHPDRIAKYANKLTTTAKSYNANASFQDIGRDLSSDFYRKNYTSREEAAHFAHLAPFDEVKENDFNLSVSTYVEQEDTREIIDIKKLNAEIAEIVKREDMLRAEIDRIIAEIENE